MAVLMLLHASEKWALNRTDKRLDKAEIKFLGIVAGHTLSEEISNQTIWDKLQIFSIGSKIWIAWKQIMLDVDMKLNSGLSWQKQHSTRRRLFTSKLDLNLRKKLVKCYIWSRVFYGVETWTLRKVEQKYLGSFEVWCWRWMEKISWIDRVRNEDVSYYIESRRRQTSYIK